jgi:hypothetical protein
MEDVLSVYERPFDEALPVVCVDEKSKQLLSDVRTPVPPARGRARREDYEYKPGQVVNFFMHFEPLSGKSHVSITDRRTKCDWAHDMKHLADVEYPLAQRIVVVMDNLNVHSPASFYQAFEPAEARRLVERFDFHYTPKHGSWLNMAEIGLSILERQCLARRFEGKDALKREIKAWDDHRNARPKLIDWQFDVEQARCRLKRLYPEVEMLN